MKKILLITLEFPPRVGGIASYLEGFCGTLDPARLVVLAEPARNDFAHRTYPYPLIRERLLYRRFWPRWWRGYKAAKRLCAHEEIGTVIISHLLPMGYVALLLRKSYIVMCHGMDVLMAQRTPLKKALAQQVLRRARLVVANSLYTKGLLMRMGVPESSVRVVRPCPEPPKEVLASALAAFQERRGIAGHRYVLSLGRLVERKGYAQTLEAFALLAPQFPDLRYVIAGSGPERARLQKLVAQLHLSERVIFIDRPTDDERALLFAGASLFVLAAYAPRPYDVEGFGLTLLEAQSYGVPVIGGDSGGVPEALVEGKSGLIVNATDPRELANAMGSILSDQARARAMGEVGRGFAAGFEWKKEAASIIEYL